MKNETKNKIIIILSILFFISVLIIVLGIFNKCTTDSEYQRILTTNRELNTKLSEVNTELESKNTELTEIESEFTEYRDTTEAAVIQLSENLNEANEIISGLKDDTISIQTTTEGVSEATSGIREILSEITGN